MAKKKDKKKSSGASNGWLITFSDLVTLLLTFFVLLLSMSSMDRSFLTKISLFAQDVSFMTIRGSGKIPPKPELVVDLLQDPIEAVQQQDRIKDLLFPDDIVPESIDRAMLDENLQILERDDGVALVLSDKLLFGVSETTLNPAAEELLAQVGQVLGFATAPVVVSGHSDASGGQSDINYELSAQRALAVLGVLTNWGVDPRRASVGAYGPDRPLDKQELLGVPPGDANARNRRVEILLKTKPDLGNYS